MSKENAHNLHFMHIMLCYVYCIVLCFVFMYSFKWYVIYCDVINNNISYLHIYYLTLFIFYYYYVVVVVVIIIIFQQFIFYYQLSIIFVVIFVIIVIPVEISIQFEIILKRKKRVNNSFSSFSIWCVWVCVEMGVVCVTAYFKYQKYINSDWWWVNE